MPKITSQTNVLSITSDKSVLDSIENIIETQKGYKLIDSASLEEEIIEGISSLQPDCILLDFNYDGNDALKLIDSISVQFPKIAIIVILDKKKLSLSNEVILAGARAFILKPLSAKKLFETLDRVRELLIRSNTAQLELEDAEYSKHSQGSFVVFSPKGGAGVSTVAVNIALSMLEHLEKEVLLIDGKLLFGHLDLMLNLRTQNSINDLIAHVGSLDEELIKDVVTEHVTGLKLLPGPKTIISGQGIKPEDIYKLLGELQNVYDYTVIDGGNFLNENVVTYMDASNKIVLVVNPDITSLRDARQFFDVCRSLNYPKDKVQIVINKYNKKDGLSLDEIEKSLQIKVLGTLPLDNKAALQSINRGIPIALQQKRAPLKQAYLKLAKDLLKTIEKNSSSFIKKSSTSDTLSKSSRLG